MGGRPIWLGRNCKAIASMSSLLILESMGEIPWLRHSSPNTTSSFAKANQSKTHISTPLTILDNRSSNRIKGSMRPTSAAVFTNINRVANSSNSQLNMESILPIRSFTGFARKTASSIARFLQYSNKLRVAKMVTPGAGHSAAALPKQTWQQIMQSTKSSGCFLKTTATWRCSTHSIHSKNYSLASRCQKRRVR